MKVAALLLCTLAVALAGKFKPIEYQAAFTNWVAKYSKSYPHDEYQYRYSVFKKNLDYIATHNEAKHSYTLAMNQFGDLTSAEFAKHFLGLKKVATQKSVFASPTNPALPTSWDWNKKGAVTPVRTFLFSTFTLHPNVFLTNRSRTNNNVDLAGLSLP